MILRLLMLVLACVCTPLLAAPRTLDSGSLIVLCYHDVVEDIRAVRDRHAINVSELVAHFAWLKSNGFNVVSLDRVIASRAGGATLPPRAVLLTFDDGYRSHYSRVFPLLKLFGYPAVMAVVGSWLEIPAGGIVPFEPNAVRRREEFVGWTELKEMADTGLVEVASHSFNLHHGVLGNRHGNTQPAATTRTFDPVTQNYEDDSSYRRRIRADLARNNDLMFERLGQRPRAIAWPFGSFNEASLAIAAELGLSVTLTLEDGVNAAAQPLNQLRRMIVDRNPSTQDLAWSVHNLAVPEPQRFFHVTLDELYDADPDEQERRLSRLLDRLVRMPVNTVVLSALSEQKGEIVAAYFPNRQLPVRADLLNRVAWQMMTRARMRVLVRLADNARVVRSLPELYEDLAKHGHFNGLYFEPSDRGQAPGLLRAALAHRAPLQSIVGPTAELLKTSDARLQLTRGGFALGGPAVSKEPGQ